MAKELDVIEKKLSALKANKAKEEAKSKEFIEKLTAKFNEDSKNLKAIYDGKVADSKKDLNSKLAVLNPDIAYYEKQKKALEDLEEAKRKLMADVDAREAKKGE